MLTGHTVACEYEFLSVLSSDAGSGSGDGGKSYLLVSLCLYVHALSFTTSDFKRMCFALCYTAYCLLLSIFTEIK